MEMGSREEHGTMTFQTTTTKMDSGEKRLNELGYKQELRREMVGEFFQDTGNYILMYGSVHRNASVWTKPVVCRPCKLDMGMGCCDILHLPILQFDSILGCRLWTHPEPAIVIETVYAAYSGAQALQIIILLSTGTNKGGGYFAPRSVFLCIYMGYILIWAVLNSFALKVIAYLNIISIWWQVVGGLVVIIMLPLVAYPVQPASYVFTHFETAPENTGISSKPYAVIMSVLLSNYCLYGYDAAAHLTEETKGADRTGPIAILTSIAIITNPSYLYDVNNETAGALVPAQIIYDAFYGRFHNSTGAVVFLCIIWGSFFFCGLSVTTSAARVGQRNPIFANLAKNSPGAKGSRQRSVAMRGPLHHPRATHIETQRGVHSHRFHKYDRMGRQLRCPDFREARDGSREIQARALLPGQGKQDYLLGGILVDLLYMFSLLVANSLPYYLEHI
ncbi:hypothetical protein RHGRI_037867 [Rhododendron griersonianum]|uniref:Amino acid transporter n=1 Tax=Rhododendron griersonianum TaxID=479676 RepID=A0AAV6HXK9_9ERIC|nr:hypothetical protein RHGRI_037867 [Rhododendron griersonianum]